MAKKLRREEVKEVKKSKKSEVTEVEQVRQDVTVEVRPGNVSVSVRKSYRELTLGFLSFFA